MPGSGAQNSVLPADDLVCKSRLLPSTEQISIARKHANRAREAAIVLVREYCGESLEQVAEQFGGVSRSAITETARIARQREADNTAFRAAVERIRARLD